MKNHILVCIHLALALVVGGAVADEVTFALIGVSGTLQDGFELRDRLDYHPPCADSEPSCDDTIPAKFVGKALVRGYKAYLDIKPKGWRE